VNEPALEALRQTVAEQEKGFDLIIVTGDWTQRARPHEFELAIDFVKGLSCPVLSVPGNHDVPLYDLGRRLFAPYSRYSKLRPLTLGEYRDDIISVVGLSTVNPLRAMSGYVGEGDLIRAANGFRQADPATLRIVACHHPLFDPRTKDWLRPENRSRALLDLKPDVVLSGHSHEQWIEATSFNDQSVLHISAGTSISNRLREQVNSFHILEIRRHSSVEAPRGLEMHVKTYDLRHEGFLERGLPTRQFQF
jgi:3',5'-cyclic AMP phosphodiesterase CpdA